MIDRRLAVRLGIAAPLLGLFGGRIARATDEKMVLKASDVHPEGYPTVQAVEDMGKKLSDATGGRLTIQMYASMQLGGEKEAIEQAQVGAIQLARVSVGALGPVVSDLNVFNLPFLFRNTAHMEKVRGSSAEIPIYEYRVAGEEYAAMGGPTRCGARSGSAGIPV